MPKDPSLSRIVVMFATAVIGGIAFPETVRADSEEDSAIHRGVELRKAGKDQAALEEFQKAYSLTKSGRSLAQIGLAEQALGRWVDAEAHLEQALSSDTTWIRKNTPALHKALVAIRPHVGILDIVGPPGAEARINGLIMGTLPFVKPVRLPIGTANVELTKAGFLATSRTVSVSPGVLTRESIDLEPARPPSVEGPGASVPAATSMPTASVVVREQSNPRSPPDPARDEAQSWHRPLAWGTGVAAVLGVGGGVTALLIRQRKISDIAKYQCNPKDGTVNPPDPANAFQCADLATGSSKWGVTAVVSFSIAGALTIASGVLFATLPSKPSASVALACAANLATPGAVCQLTF